MVLSGGSDINPLRLLIPARDLFAGGDICIKIPRDMLAHIVGMMSPLTDFTVWSGTEAQRALTVRQVETFLAEIGTARVICTPDTVEIEIIRTVYIGEDCPEDCECDDMGCVLPKDSIMWIDGVLYYRTCDGLEIVPGDAGAVVFPPGDDIVPDPPPDGFETPTICDKALAISEVLISLVELCHTNAALIPAPIEFIEDVKREFPGYSWDTIKLAGAFFSAYSLRGFGESDDNQDDTVKQLVRCAIARAIDNGGVGSITKNEQQAIGISINLALSDYFDKPDFILTKASHVGVWNNIYGAMPYNLIAGLTYAPQPQSGLDCDCPVPPGAGETNPTASGWYLGIEFSETIECPDGFDFGIYSYCNNPIHDVFGVVFAYEYVSGAPINRLKRANDCENCTEDFCLTTSNSDTHTVGVTYCQMANGAYGELNGSLNNPTQINQAGKVSDNPASPLAVPTDVLGFALAGQATGPGGSNTTFIRFKMRLLHNTNSPSHA